MSLLWRLTNPYDFSIRPFRLLDQHFGLTLEPEDLSVPLVSREIQNMMNFPGYYQPWQSMISGQDTGSALNIDGDKFQVNLDVQQFMPQEISVKVTGENIVTVEGKHDEKQDEHGSIFRHFVRRYVLPQGYDVGKMVSRLSSDGVLTITAPKIVAENQEYRTIPITRTGQPSKAEKKEDVVQEKDEKGDK